jgi:hypothetical protein
MSHWPTSFDRYFPNIGEFDCIANEVEQNLGKPARVLNSRSQLAQITSSMCERRFAIF